MADYTIPLQIVPPCESDGATVHVLDRDITIDPEQYADAEDQKSQFEHADSVYAVARVIECPANYELTTTWNAHSYEQQVIRSTPAAPGNEYLYTSHLPFHGTEAYIQIRAHVKTAAGDAEANFYFEATNLSTDETTGVQTFAATGISDEDVLWMGPVAITDAMLPSLLEGGKANLMVRIGITINPTYVMYLYSLKIYVVNKETSRTSQTTG
jgi:hypothetical protein